MKFTKKLLGQRYAPMIKKAAIPSLPVLRPLSVLICLDGIIDTIYLFFHRHQRGRIQQKFLVRSISVFKYNGLEFLVLSNKEYGLVK